MIVVYTILAVLGIVAAFVLYEDYQEKASRYDREHS